MANAKEKREYRKLRARARRRKHRKEMQKGFLQQLPRIMKYGILTGIFLFLKDKVPVKRLAVIVTLLLSIWGFLVSLFQKKSDSPSPTITPIIRTENKENRKKIETEFLKFKVNFLEKELRSQKREYEKLRKQNDKNICQITEFKTLYKSSEQELVFLNKSQLKERILKQETLTFELKNKLEKKDSELIYLQQNLDELNQKFQETTIGLSVETELTKRKLAEKQNQLDQVETRLAELTQGLGAIVTELETAKDELSRSNVSKWIILLLDRILLTLTSKIR